MLNNVWNVLKISFSLSQFHALKKEANKHHKISRTLKYYATAMADKIFGPVKSSCFSGRSSRH